MTLLVIIILIAITSGGSEFVNSECSPRSYGSDSIVCVCNGSHCDKIPREPKPARGTIVQITSSMEGLRFARTTLQFGNISQNSIARIMVQRSLKYQEMIGFGGTFTDSATMVIKSLPEDAQEQLIRSYFSEDGIEYNMGRVPIGGSDFSTRPYTCADKLVNDTAFLFELPEEDVQFKIPVIKQAVSVMPGPDEMFLTAAVWSPPVWMKTNDKLDGLGFLQGEYYQEYADYHMYFLDAYAEFGLGFWSISTGNEPLLGLATTFLSSPINSLGWILSRQGLWIRQNLGPTLKKSQHNKTKILTCDEQTPLLNLWVSWVLGDPVTSNYIDGFGIHWYMDYFPSITINNLEKTHEKFPNKFLIFTEASFGVADSVKVILGAWFRAEELAEHMILAINHWVTGWIDWNIALDTEGGPTYINNYLDAAIIVNAPAREFYKQPTFFIQGHFSKFVPRGSRRVSVETTYHASPFLFSLFRKFDNKNICTVGFERPDGVIVLIVLNKSRESVLVEMVDDRSGVKILNLPKRSISTLLYV